jgi:DNA-binding transcriptional LysR family regulator
MDIRQFRVLRTVLQTGSVSAAARTLNISQPAVSKTLSLIEEEMDLRLFERLNGRLIPTPQAHALCPDIDKILADFALVKQTARELRDGKRGRITIASPPTGTASIVPLAIQSFRQHNPSVEFTIKATTTPEVVEMVARNEAEIGICQPSSGDPQVLATDLCTGIVMCIMRRDDELCRLKYVRSSDVADRDIITFPVSEPTGARIFEAFKNDGYRLRPYADVNQSLTAGAMVSAGTGIGLVDSFLPMKSAFPDLIARPFSPAIALRIQMMTSAQRILSPIANAFREELVIAAKQWASAGGR